MVGVEFVYDYNMVKAEVRCDKQDCAFCRMTVNNEGNMSEENLVKIGLVEKNLEATVG
jgi:hypothetical protein